MYGLINKAVHDLVTSKFGEAKWAEICQKAGVSDPNFITMVKYPDDVTYRLVGAASELLNVPAADILEAFGEHWTVYSATAGFGHLLDFAGDNLVDFLSNLDSMHTRVALTFPELDPPSFRVTDVTADSLRLHYYSKRPGLTPVAMGMVKGLGKRFKTPLKIRLDRGRADGHDHDEFIVTYGEAARA
ncbi:MAG: heme NO-binding protein [Alphaproteobacteria bacterium]|nr:heme NO-binding protein [Alphaproteobacteria bacterium]